MSGYYLQRRGDSREEGPFSEEELLDWLDNGEIDDDDWCRPAGQTRARPVGELFQVISPEEEEEEDPTDLPEPTDPADPLSEEHVLYRGSPSLLSYTSQLAAIAVVLAAGWWVGAFGLWWVVGAVGVALLLLVRLLLHRAAREYVVTTERVESTVGLLRRETREIRLRDLQAIRLRKTGSLGWLGVGTIIFARSDAPEEDVVFERIARARRVIARVCEWQKRAPRV